MTSQATDVLIVGGGPTGIGLAIELGRRNIRTILVDQSTGNLPFPSFNLWSWNSAEILRRWGLADELRYAGFPSDFPHTARYTTGIDGFEIVEFPQPSNRTGKGAYDYSAESPLWSPNFFSEPVLRRKAASFDAVDLRFQTELKDFEQTDSGLTATLEHVSTGQKYEIKTAFLVGCDGSRSQVRDKLAIDLDGVFSTDHQLAIHFRAPLHEFSKFEPCVHTWILKPEVRALLVAVNGHDRWRCGPLGLKKDEVETRTPLEWLRLILGDRVPLEVLGASPWGGHYAVAEHFGTSRVFIAGDAAHLMWPAGGLGMNTGLGDAMNLGWKLAATLQGWGGPALLASYDVERRPLAKDRVEGAADRRAADGFPIMGLLGEDSEQAQRCAPKSQPALKIPNADSNGRPICQAPISDLSMKIRRFRSAMTARRRFLHAIFIVRRPFLAHGHPISSSPRTKHWWMRLGSALR